MDAKGAIEMFEKDLACRELDPQECATWSCQKCQYNVEPASLEEAYGVALDALRKADPKKVDTEKDEYGCAIRYYCPTCGTYFGTRGRNSTILFHRPKYCDCGQAIDWTE